MKFRIVALYSVVLGLLYGCSAEITEDGRVVVCTTQVVPAIEVAVFEQETGFASACGATVTIEDGNFTQSLTNDDSSNCNDNFIFAMADEREGSYDITVSKAGFQDWIQRDVRVTSNVCHVNTVTVQAYLES